jgi:hypothetical protein
MTHECIFRGRVHIRWPTHMYKRKTKWVRVRTASWLAPNHNTNKSDHRRNALASIKFMFLDRYGTQMHLGYTVVMHTYEWVRRTHGRSMHESSVDLA